MAAINQIQPLQSITGVSGSKSVTPAGQDKDNTKVGFGKWLEKSIGEVNQLQKESAEATQKLLTGESKDIHSTMIAMQKSSIAMELTMEVRNKIIAAYDEIKRMQF